MTFSSAVNSGSRWWNWKTNPIFRLRNSASAWSSMANISFLSKRTVPLVGRSRVPRMWSRVVLPTPEAPTMATSSPRLISRLTPFSTWTTVWSSLKDLRRSRASIMCGSFVPERLSRIETSGLPAGMDCGQERDSDRRHGDRHHIHDLDVHRDAAQIVDVPRQGVESLDRPAEAVAQWDADDRADDADHESVQHEDARHGLAGRAHRLQDGDLPVLLDDDHGERAHDVEGGDDHDQHQQDEHHELLQLERREQVFVELHPVARPVGEADRVLDRLGDAVRSEDVRDLHLDAGYRVADVEELLRLLDRHVDQRRIVLVHPGFEHADHTEAPHLREHAQGADGADRRDDVQPIAHEGAQPQRQLLADDDAGEPRWGRGRLVRLQVLQLAGAEVLRDLRDRRFAPHIDTAQHDAVRAALRREQHLLEDERGGGDHLRDGGHFVRQRGVVLDRLAGPRGDDDVRVGAEDLGLQVFLEARHDAQRGDQGRHADGHADDGDERIERDV